MYLQFLKSEFVVRYTSRKSGAVHLIKPFEGNTKNVPCQLSVTGKSEEFVTSVFENIQQHGKPFNIRKPKELINITICLFLRNMTMISYLF